MSTEGRLSSLGEKLAAALRAGSPEAMRRFAAACARLTATEVGLDTPAVGDALAAADWLAGGGDALADRVQSARDAVAAVVKRLDEEGFRIHQHAEEMDAFDTDAFRAEYGAAFNRARAANAVLTALLPDAREAAAETAYEANVGADIAEDRLLALAATCGLV